ncbi:MULTISPECIES: Zn-ribbon domain-containing OB-fold protein [Pseudonocardia]|uniref:ChsH2 C-terminal OB-fold domain-containing protein n=1 Tax=Pseudonocardia autotrophica TaxID=2074 RepID=A0A1Y2N6P5_PSEAH|nr:MULTISPECIES: OB-fold domain-containing protein [Pseudonocardia]OSY43146.1 hypothetical protein BG845_00751 [Pseudonocardia autotrophica]
MTIVDPRPRIVAAPDGAGLVTGVRCADHERCPGRAAFDWPACPSCGGAVEPAEFGPGGTVWSSTVVRIPVPGRTPPYPLAYVDLDDGPRVLAHTTEQQPIGARVRLLGPSAPHLMGHPGDGDGGDVRAEPSP